MLTDESLAFDRFLDEQTWRDTTIVFYRYIVGRLFRWMRVRKISGLATMEISQVKMFIESQGWGNSMTRKLNSVLVQFLKAKYGELHPLTRWRVRREISPPQRTLDFDQTMKLLANFQPGVSDGYSNRSRRFVVCDLLHPLGIRNLAIIWMLLDTGLRSSEICRLELGRLNLNARTVTAFVKFGKWRTAMFSDRTAEALKAWLAIRNEFLSERSGDRLFFGVMNGFAGMPLTSAGLRSMLRNLGRVTGIGPLSPHDFRRTFATLATRAGASIQAVKEAGGWSNTEMVVHYTRAIKASEIAPHLPGNILHAKSPSS